MKNNCVDYVALKYLHLYIYLHNVEGNLNRNVSNRQKEASRLHKAHLSFNQFIYLSIYPSVYLYFYLSKYLFYII